MIDSRVRNNEVVVVGTFYSDVACYIGDYLTSLSNQTCNDFDVLIANNGLDEFDFRGALLEGRCHSFKVNGSISSNRRKLIRRALQMGYKSIVFTDCDDTFELNRIEIIIKLLEQSSIVVNDLDITNENGKIITNRYFSKRFSEPVIFSEHMIKSGNIMGLSNTAVRADSLNDIAALREGSSIAFDWYLWACAFNSGERAIFTSETSTKYRIHGNNTAGLPQELNESSIYKGIKVKLQHYALMQKINMEYRQLHEDFSALSISWQDNSWRNEYIDALRRSEIKVHMWWENIRPPFEVGLG